MKISLRTQQLKSIFSYEKKAIIEDRPLEIRPYRFIQRTGENEINCFQESIPTTEFCPIPDNGIEENKNFPYVVFVPKGTQKTDQAILLLHGLNERSWEKYLTWAEFLSLATGKAVILFPIAFHMNRTPSNWYNPRAILPWVTKRKQQISDLSNSTFVNVALSCRLSESPIRFYASGRESIFNLWQLLSEIKQGKHPLFKEDSSVNIFAYSIGALLAQILFLANPDHLVQNSRLFMFCGGSIFSQMNGNARDIMDQEAYGRVRHYFLHNFLENNEHHRMLPTVFKEDFLEKAFKAMLVPETLKEYRETFFKENKERIKILTLKNDIVMPTSGVIEALGVSNATTILEEWDFPYDYNHQNPFPSNTRIAPELLYQSFKGLFNKAASFL
ncbi:DUF6051 family protein [uncultured Sanguibacteroides sp.]|uniref:DUF6051 family protein n=1 Tax=uncultured Sanguibacteroides sp. TaxID=1635151 RepID=UPI0025CCCD3B|nr:DUF6051 family protein [uncultured Sanguibacteroides sp.]